MTSIVTIVADVDGKSAAGALLSHVTRRVLRAGNEVAPIQLAEPGGEVGDQESAAFSATVRTADALVLACEIDRTGPLEIFLDRLPPAALRGKPILALVVGGATVPASFEPALLRRLDQLGAAVSGRSIVVPASQLRVFADGGVLIDPASAVRVASSIEGFLAEIGTSAPRWVPVPGRRVSPVAGAPDLTVSSVQVGDPELRPLLDELVVEYGTRYAHLSAHSELAEVPASDFLPPDGAFLVVTENGESIAGGALRRYDEQTAEVKRVWTSSRHRRRGLAARVMAELEHRAAELGYARMHLTTGPRQPEARALYLATGYQPRFDVTADPETIGPLAFGKELMPGAGLAHWVQPTWAQAQARYAVPAGAAR